MRAEGLVVERVEDDDLVDAVEELRPERRPQRVATWPSPARPALVGARAAEQLRADVAGHDDDGVLEADRAALAVGQAPVVEDLEQDVEHVRVRLLDLVEQDDLVRAPPDRLGELAALLVADVARAARR